MLDFPYFIYCIIFHKLNNSVNYICVQIALLNTNASNTNCTTNASTNLILLIIFAYKLHNKLHYKIQMPQIQIALQNTNASNTNCTTKYKCFKYKLHYKIQMPQMQIELKCLNSFGHLSPHVHSPFEDAQVKTTKGKMEGI